jgi:hypothetical protein
LHSVERVDTSLLYDEFRNKYNKSGKEIDVDFRKLVAWIRLGDQFTHQIHPYPAKLLPNIAHFFLQNYKGSVPLSGQ